MGASKAKRHSAGLYAGLAIALLAASAWAGAPAHHIYYLNGTAIQVTVSGGGFTPLKITFANVSQEVVTSLLQKVQPGTALDTSGVDVTIGYLTYNCAATGPCSKVVITKEI